MTRFLMGLIVGSLLSTGAAWAIHDIGHTTIFPEGGMLDRWQRDDDFQKARRFEQAQRRTFLNPCKLEHGLGGGQ